MFAIRLVTFLVLVFPFSSYAGWFFGKNKEPERVYDIEKTVFDSLTSKQQQHIIEAAQQNQEKRSGLQEEITVLKNQIASLETLKEHIDELHKEKGEYEGEITKLKEKIASQEKALANFLAVSEDLLEAKAKRRNYKEREKRDRFFPKIASIKRGFNSTMVHLENETLLEISPFDKEATDAWLVGQTVELEKGEGLVYILNASNLDTGESVPCKIKETP